MIDLEMRHHEAASRQDEWVEHMDKMIEPQVLANEAAHERFEEEHKRLLRAQILMNGAMQRLEVKMEETTDKLNGLIATVNGFIKGGAKWMRLPDSGVTP